MYLYLLVLDLAAVLEVNDERHFVAGQKPLKPNAVRGHNTLARLDKVLCGGKREQSRKRARLFAIVS
jgi:hypothetical protein